MSDWFFYSCSCIPVVVFCSCTLPSLHLRQHSMFLSCCVPSSKLSVSCLPASFQLSQVHRSMSQSSVVVKGGQERRWSACVHILEGHVNSCSCVAFSPDGGCLAPTTRTCQ